MSLMLMGIGVVTLATLFPISILRSVQATQLTNAAILRYNAEAQIGLMPSLVHDPDGVDDPAVNGDRFEEHYRSPANRDYIVDPLGWVIVANDGGAADSFGPLLRRFHGGRLRYVESNGIPGLQVGEQTVPPDTRTEDDAEEWVTLPDSWTFQIDGVPTASNLSGAAPYRVTMPIDVDLNNIPFDANPDRSPSRLVLFDSTGRLSHTRAVINIDPATGDVDFTPAVSGTFNLGQVRIETKERRYTWLLTVRKHGDGKADVDVVVFFRRTFSPEDEQVHSASFFDPGPDGDPGVTGVDDDGNGITDDLSELDFPGSDDSKGADGQWGVAGVDDDNNGTVDDESERGFPGSDDHRTVKNVDISAKPFLKRGGFVLDAQNARWYRIQEIRETASNRADLVVESDIVEPATAGAIFMRGVIEVFPIGTKALP